MQPEARERLGHVQQAAEAILRYTHGKSFQDYEREEMVRAAVERQFMIVGEAMREAIKIEPSIPIADHFVSKDH